MGSSMKLVPAAPLPPPKQLLPPRQSPKPTDGIPEISASDNGQTKSLEPQNGYISARNGHDTSTSLLHVRDIDKKEPSVVPSLFAQDSQDIMDDIQVAENDNNGAKKDHTEGNHTMNNTHIVGGGYAGENGFAMESEKQQTLQALQPDANIEEDTLPSADNIAAQVSNHLQPQESEKLEDDDVDVAEEDEGPDFEDENSASSGNDHEHKASGRNRDSIKAKKSNNRRRKLASTPREYVARLREKEDHKLAQKKKDDEGKSSAAKRSRKRKLTEGDVGPSKTLKTANGTSFDISNGGTSSSNVDPLPPAQSIDAKTHADQMAQIMAGIPENCDNRRKSTQKRDLVEAKSVFGYKKVEADNGKWKIKGMQSSIHSYQLTAVAWMVKRELAPTKPFGGILADTMGMGKTVMALACIMGNQASGDDLAKFCKATLVIVPSKDIASQWQEEAQKHWSSPDNHMTFVYVRRRGDAEQAVKWCKENLLVIATYSQLTKDYPDKAELRRLAEKYGTDSTSYHRELDKIVGPLFRINWYRIILDEAHAIKNAESEASRVCCELFGKYRWALSGTPLANSSQEMYPYMRFLQLDWTSTRRKFLKSFFFGDEPTAEFDALTSLIMYRRTLNDSFLGRQIINLPRQNEIDLWVPMSAEEHCILETVTRHYEEIKLRCQLGELGLGDLKDIENVEDADNAEDHESDNDCRQKPATKDGSKRPPESLLQRANQVRQRQSTSHTFCLERYLREDARKEHIDGLRDKLNEVVEVDSPRTILDQMQVGMKPGDKLSKYKIGLEIQQERKEPFFGKVFDLMPLLEILSEECNARDATCLLCNTAKPPKEPMTPDECSHVFCRGCLVPAINQAIGAGKQIDCPHENCTKKLSEAKDMDVRSIQKIIQEAEKKGSGYCDPARDSYNVSVHQGNDQSGFFIASTFRNDFPVLPSTKLTATMAVVLTWLHEAPKDKILIFTQFRGTARMLGYMLRTLHIGFVYYLGGLSSMQKAKALDAIKSDDDIKVMVATLKSGGQSLNLTAANRVISIDPWWNKTAEQQAFGRVVRIGQEKETYFVKIHTREPVGIRISTLQEKKAKDVDRTLQDNGHTSRPVSEAELEKIFSRKQE